jgi:hypothetical protein
VVATLEPEQLRSVRTIEDVIAYLQEELDWPVGDLDLEKITFTYTPDELGIRADRMPKLRSLRHLRPITPSQPWGIFFVEFDGPRLPVTALRRLLQSLVAKKRQGGSGSLRTWALRDLLFVIVNDFGESVELHFVAFVDDDSEVEIRTVPWRPSQSPDQHLRRLATELLPHLAWPDDPSQVDAWRDEWRQAFKLRHGEAISSASRLAERMADTAQHLRAQIDDALVAEEGSGPFSDLLDEVRTELVAGVTDARFADMCAQTLVYGVLASRVTDPIGFGASPTLTAVPLANPFLSAFFEQVHDQAAGLDLDASGLEQLVADLRRTNVEAILDQFGSTARGGDPVIHFYEEFLKRYDKRMRADAGAFYTPQPIVQFMVRCVDELLKSRFGLAAGIAEHRSWAAVADENGFTVPPGVSPSESFVSMIDPATGTGTFLVEWIRQARRSYTQVHGPSGWPAYLRDRILPSMHAFELMLGPYAIAHLRWRSSSSIRTPATARRRFC